MSATQNQYSIGLDKTPANYVALTPLSFLARTAAVYPDHVSTVYEGRSFTWSRDLCALPAFCLLPRRPRHRPRRYGRGDAAEYPRDERTAFCGADGRRRAQRAQHPARCGLDRVPARSWRRENHPGRSGIFRRDRRSADADEGPKTFRHRRRRCGLRRRQADRRTRIRGGGGAGRSKLRRTAARRRMGRHCAQLHLGHHGQSRRAS